MERGLLFTKAYRALLFTKAYSAPVGSLRPIWTARAHRSDLTGDPGSVAMDGLVNDQSSHGIYGSSLLHARAVQWRSCRPAC
jgi:hypothetical protein